MRISNDMTCTVSQDIAVSRLRDLLTCAFEGGSNYWYTITRYLRWDGVQMVEIPRDELPEFPHINVPFQVNCAVEIQDIEDEFSLRLLGLNDVFSGAKAMAAKYPKHWGDVMTENDDADTGDVFLQCCLFDEVIYG